MKGMLAGKLPGFAGIHCHGSDRSFDISVGISYHWQRCTFLNWILLCTRLRTVFSLRRGRKVHRTIHICRGITFSCLFLVLLRNRFGICVAIKLFRLLGVFYFRHLRLRTSRFLNLGLWWNIYLLAWLWATSGFQNHQFSQRNLIFGMGSHFCFECFLLSLFDLFSIVYSTFLLRLFTRFWKLSLILILLLHFCTIPHFSLNCGN
jgi:hypothetical protein